MIVFVEKLNHSLDFSVSNEQKAKSDSFGTSCKLHN